jgi:hypothetical protein
MRAEDVQYKDQNEAGVKPLALRCACHQATSAPEPERDVTYATPCAIIQKVNEEPSTRTFPNILSSFKLFHARAMKGRGGGKIRLK